jgi:hypothetical protein
MTIADLSTMLGIPIDTLYGWRHRGEGPRGYRRRPPRSLSPLQRRGLARGASRPPSVRTGIGGWLTSSDSHSSAGRLWPPSSRHRYRVRYRDESGRQHCETKTRLVDAERRKVEIEVALAGGTWRDPRRGEMRLHEWVELCYPRDMIFEHNSVSFTLTRYGGLFEDNADAAIDRLDALLGNSSTTSRISDLDARLRIGRTADQRLRRPPR